MIPLLLSLALLQAGQSAAPPEGAGATCEIGGRITEKETGRPLARAVVRLNLQGVGSDVFTRSDEQGRYVFAGLRAGTYSLMADGGPHRATHQMAFYVDPARRGQPLVLKEGEVRRDVDIALARSHAITLRVVDPEGEPVAGVMATLKPAGGSGSYAPGSHMRQSDDRGLLRAFSLDEGRYTICVEPAIGMTPGVTPRTRDRERFVRTCYPSAASEAEAQPVLVDATTSGELLIRMLRRPTFTISGTVLDAAGAPATTARASLGRFTRGGSTSMMMPLNPDGGFIIYNVPPGDYALQAEVGGDPMPQLRRPLERAFHPLRVEAADITGLVVALAPGVDVAGQIVLDEPSATLPKPQGSGLMVRAVLDSAQSSGGGDHLSTIANDGRVFVLKGVFGRRRLELANVPRGWYVKSVQYGGKEIIDTAVELKPGTDPSGLEIVLSRRGAAITGRVVDERGEGVRGARVLALPADRAQWGGFDRITATASSSGAFRLGPHRAGSYIVIAIPPSDQFPFELEPLARLAAGGESVTLDGDEERSIDLRIVRIR